VETISISAGQRIVIKAMFYTILCAGVIGLTTAGALLYAFGSLSQGTRRSKTVADGYIYITVLVLTIIVIISATSPALLVLQPLRLRRVLRAEKAAKTPRQRFRGMVVVSSVRRCVVLTLCGSYISWDVQPAVCDGLLYTGGDLCKYVHGDIPLDRPPGRPFGILDSSWYGTSFSLPPGSI
jgi:hypothetical protein